MPIICSQCKRELPSTAKFCRFCGSAIVAVPEQSSVSGSSVIAADSSRPGGVAVQAPPHVAQGEAYCRECGELNANVAWFCRKCGKPLTISPSPPQPVREPRPLPPREVSVKVPDIGQAMNRINASGGGKIADFGAALALLGCFLPLASAGGESITVAQGITQQDGSFLLILPLSAVAIAVMASAGGSSRMNRTMLGGGVIALSSPWAVLWLLLMFGGQRLISSLGMFSFGAQIGIGTFALAIGFSVALIGGFVILHRAASAA